MPKMTARQQKFIQYYDGNATQAAIKAGYSKLTAARTGSENLQKPYIREAIEKRNKAKDAPIIASRQERQKFWTDSMNDASLAMADRHKASELLGRSEGDFTEKIQHTGGVTVAMGRIKKGSKVLGFKVGTPRSS